MRTQTAQQVDVLHSAIRRLKYEPDAVSNSGEGDDPLSMPGVEEGHALDGQGFRDGMQHSSDDQGSSIQGMRPIGQSSGMQALMADQDALVSEGCTHSFKSRAYYSVTPVARLGMQALMADLGALVSETFACILCFGGALLCHVAMLHLIQWHANPDGGPGCTGEWSCELMREG